MAVIFPSIFADLGALLAVICWLVYWYIHKNYDYWKKRNIPYIEPQKFFGNIKDIVLFKKHQNLVFQDLYKQLEGHKYGGVFQIHAPTLLVRDPDVLKAIMVKDFTYFHDRGIHVDMKLNPLTQNLFFMDGWQWRSLRNKLSPTFTSGKIKGMFHLMDQSITHLQEYLAEPASKGEVLELKEVLAKFTTDVIGTCAFGLQMNALDDPNSEFRTMGKKLFETHFIQALRSFMTIFVPRLASVLRFGVLESKVNDFFLNVVKETIEYREKNNIKRNDFLQLLMQLRSDGGMDDDDEKETNQIKNKNSNLENRHLEIDYTLLSAQVFVFFVGGFETSSTTMSFALHELAVNQEVQTKLRDEIDRTLEETGGKFTYDAIMGMKYMDKVVNETLRKYPPVGNLVREVTVPYLLTDENAKLDVGTKVVIPVYALHYDSKYYPNPERFDPERFSEEEKAKRPNYVFLPFGDGPRNCIGMRFGLLQTKTGLAALLSKYEFHVCDQTEIPLRIDPKVPQITSSCTGTILKVTNRSSKVV